MQPNTNKTREQVHPGFRVIHLHPTLQCNLACKHCYSSSAPHLKGGLQAKQVIPLLEQAQQYGFDALSVSGGEPFIYKDLGAILETSKSLGYYNAVASNAMLLKSKRAQATLDSIDLMAVSIDGDEQLHDYIRNFSGAYKKMLEGLEILRAHQKPFGLIHTVSMDSWASLIDLADFADEQGAQLLQLHPLELHGRAQYDLKRQQLNQQLLHKVFILANYLKQKYTQKMLIQLDFSHKESIRKHPQIVHYFGSDFIPTIDTLAQVLKTIIVDETGTIYPLSYGLSKDFMIGTLEELAAGIPIFERFLERWKPFYALLERTYLEIINDADKDMVVWTERIVHNSWQKIAVGNS